MYDKLIFEISKSGRIGYSFPKTTIEEKAFLDEKYLRKTSPLLPEVTELDVVRHYTNLSKKNYGVDEGFYPLGSCTMKYNPKINEEVASLPGFTGLHPLQPAETAQGALEIYYETSKMLSLLTGMAEFSFSPFAGAHGEATGLMIMKEYFLRKGDYKRNKVIVPDSAHGTNPASASVCGFEIIEVESTPEGIVDPKKT